MRVGVLVNTAAEVLPTQTTAMLIRALGHRGHEVLVLGVADLVLGAPARVRVAPAGEDLAALSSALAFGAAQLEDLSTLDALLIRTNPARDPRVALHRAALSACAYLESAGVRVINAPAGLARTASKLFLLELEPEERPDTLVAFDAGQVVALVRAAGRKVVIKPAEGTRGRGVFAVAPEDPNLAAMAEVLVASGAVVIQEHLPEAVNGDARVVLVDGEPLVVDGHLAGIRRVPAKGDHRSNLHQGGHAAPLDLDPDLDRLARSVGRRLAGHGVRLAGLDVIGGKVIEVNVFSTGGLRDAERFSGQDFSAAVVDRLLAGG